MKKFILSFLTLFLVIFSVIGQNTHTLVGRLTDSSGRQEINNATVSLVNAKDSSLIAFTRTDSSGKFSFSKLQEGNFKLSASHVNFHQLWKNISIYNLDHTVNLGNILMVDKSILTEVNIIAKRPPVVVNGDTLEFNAESFKTKPNAVVEDMLRKMPGVEIDKDGTVRVNGKRINRVLVNGKDFFNGDPTLATRNLSADAIDKVQVFDKKSDQATFTGVDDGNAERTINLKLKKERTNLLFGKASVEGGSNGRYQSKFNVNKFKGEEQISALGMSNNTNQQGFALMDVLNFSGQNKKMMKGGGGMVINNSGPEDFGAPVEGLNGSAQGITNITAGGINYNNLFNKKTDINTSEFYNNSQTDNETNILRKNLLQGSNFIYSEHNKSRKNTIGNKLNLNIDQNIDSLNSIKLKSNFASQNGRYENKANYFSTTDSNDSLNNGVSHNAASTNGYNISTDILVRHKFHKKGRTISFNEVMQFNDSRSNSYINSFSNFYNNASIIKKDTIDQQNNLKSITQSYASNITYTEPLSKKTLIEFRSFYNHGDGNLNKNTYDLDQINGKHDLKNVLLSNAFTNLYNTAGVGTSIRGLTKKYSYTAGINFQSSDLKSQLKDSAFNIHNNAYNILPLATLNYKFSKSKTLNLDYNTSVTQPSSTELQPVQDVTDPLNIKIGNPSLLPSYNHSLNAQYFSSNMGKQSNLIAFANYTATKNAIVRSDMISNSGERITKPVNANGVYNIFGLIEKGFRLKSLSTRFSAGMNVTYNHMVNFINDQPERTQNLTLTPKLSINYTYKDLLDFSITGRWNYNHIKYSLEEQLNNNYLKQEYNADVTASLKNGITLNSDFAYTVNSGRSDGYNKNLAMWNAAIAAQVLKSKKGEIKFSINNILNQNIGIDRNFNFNYVEDISYKTVKRYFMIGFTYSLQKAASGGPKITIKAF